MMKIIDNFLPEAEFEVVKTFLESEYMPWFLNHGVSREFDGHRYWTHMFAEGEDYSHFFELVTLLLHRIGVDKLLRVKANLYPSTDTIIEHPSHIDYDSENYGAVFSINTCDGYTRIGDDIIPSVANRLVIFDGTQQHNSTTCTDQYARININLNWTSFVEESEYKL